MPPLVVVCGRSFIAFDEAERAALGPAASRPPATIAPAQPPTPESTAMYCLPSGPIRHRLADDAGAGLELPELLARARVDGLEPAVHRAVEHDVAGGDECPAPHGQVFLDLHTRAGRQDPTRRTARDDRLAPRTSSRSCRRTACPRCNSPRRLPRPDTSSDAGCRRARARRVRRRLPVLHAGRRGTAVAHDLAHARGFLRHVLQAARLEIDASGGVHEAVRLRPTTPRPTSDQ